jgi:DNA invertase Pin-like site-specific DNA recombinase
VKAIILCRCSTDETRQDVELQIKPCKEYVIKQGWDYDVVDYYGSASKRIPDKLQEVLDLIAKGIYGVIVVYSMDRFSRLHPRITEKMLNHIGECKCRFISILENLDSDNTMSWYVMKGLWIYFANLYSVNLSIKVKEGMKQAKIDGKPIGRPKGSLDKKQRLKKGYYNRKYKFKVNRESK